MKKQTKKTAGKKEVAKKVKRGGEKFIGMGCPSGCSGTHSDDMSAQIPKVN